MRYKLLAQRMVDKKVQLTKVVDENTESVFEPDLDDWDRILEALVTDRPYLEEIFLDG